MGTTLSKSSSIINAVGKAATGDLISSCLDLDKFLRSEAFDEKYECGMKLGSGRFSEVFLCYNREDPSKRYAMKVITGNKYHGASLSRMKEEIDILNHLGEDHPYIIHLIESFQYQRDDGVWCAKLVMDLCEGGDLYDYINEHGAYPEEEARIVISKMVQAIAFIHSKKVIHRDIKPENILLVKANQRGTDIKMSDFGVAKQSFDGVKVPKGKSLCGSDFYLAPEMLKHEEYGAEIDMWSLGVLSYVVLCGGLPFHNQDKATLYQQIVERDIQHVLSGHSTWGQISAGAQRFIEELLVMDPTKRMTAERASKHRWLRGSLSAYELTRLPILNTRKADNEQLSENHVPDDESFSEISPIFNFKRLENISWIENSTSESITNEDSKAQMNLSRVKKVKGHSRKLSESTSPIRSKPPTCVIQSSNSLVNIGNNHLIKNNFNFQMGNAKIAHNKSLRNNDNLDIRTSNNSKVSQNKSAFMVNHTRHVPHNHHSPISNLNGNPHHVNQKLIDINDYRNYSEANYNNNVDVKKQLTIFVPNNGAPLDNKKLICGPTIKSSLNQAHFIG